MRSRLRLRAGGTRRRERLCATARLPRRTGIGLSRLSKRGPARRPTATRRGPLSSSTRAKTTTFVLGDLDRGPACLGALARGVRRALRGDHPLLAALAAEVHVPRPVARDRPPLGAASQAAHLRADRRHRGRAHVQPARGARGHAATGTTGTPGSATPPSRCTHSCASASPKRRRASWSGSRRGATSRLASDPPLRIMYRHRRPRTLPEETARTTSTGTGARGRSASATARVRQLQLDIYGELMDAVYLYNKYGDADLLRPLDAPARIVDWVCDNWQPRGRGHLGDSRRLAGSWSTRSSCAGSPSTGASVSPTSGRSRPTATVGSPMRDQIYEDVMARGWSEKHQCIHAVLR